ncbi:HEAT repeat domain-containing protein [Kitasatospora sp. NPDC091207]|uniref:HEAT repeat domain-containing protein n=1 Tax=Kitasatospora sp. NPDC091207 TaxID=3364083 RepID=UPI00381D5CFE
MDNAVGLAGRLMTAARVAQASEADHDGHAYWALVRETAAEGNGEAALRCGSGWLRSADVLERTVGCDLVGSAAATHESLRSEAATALMALAEVETETCVLSSLVCGLGRTQDRRAVPVLVRLSGHEDVDLRRHVASELTFVNSGLPDGPDVRALIRLTRDQDADVRNWAAFTLGFQLEQDTTAIRDALWTCTTDEDGEVREEGARGLARRHDPRAVPLIARLLESDSWSHSFTLDAAEILGLPELLPALAACEPDAPETDRAVAACDPVRRARMEDDAWTVVTELERLRPDIGAALSSPRYESVHGMRLTLPVTDRETADTGYDVIALLTRAGGDPVRAAGLVVADLTGSAGERTSD